MHRGAPWSSCALGEGEPQRRQEHPTTKQPSPGDEEEDDEEESSLLGTGSGQPLWLRVQDRH